MDLARNQPERMLSSHDLDVMLDTDGGARMRPALDEDAMDEDFFSGLIAHNARSSSSSSSISPRSRPHSSSFSSSTSSPSTGGSSAVSSSIYYPLSPPSFCLPPAACSKDAATPTGSPYDIDASASAKTMASHLELVPRSSSSSVKGKVLSPKVAATGELGPPVNFSVVLPGLIFRSGFPNSDNFEFLRGLKLKSILTLVLEDYPEENREFVELEGIRFFQFGIPGNKSPVVNIPDERIASALAVVLDERNYPLLIHCNKGKHRTGCLVGCLRKMQEWKREDILNEYRKHSFPKSRTNDEDFIEAFRTENVRSELDTRYLRPSLDICCPASITKP